jgi:hypothetical protein
VGPITCTSRGDPVANDPTLDHNPKKP